jgi:hypothetical protein
VFGYANMPDVPEDDVIDQIAVWQAENKAAKEQERRAEEKANADRLALERKYGSR